MPQYLPMFARDASSEMGTQKSTAGDGIECPARVAYLDEHARHHGGVGPDADESIGVGVRKRLEQRSIDDRKDRCVGADAECQRHRGDDEEGRPSEERTRREANVLRQRLPPVRNAFALDAIAIDRHDLVVCGAQVTELLSGVRFGCLTSHPTRHERLDSGLDVEPELVVDLALHVTHGRRLAQQSANTGSQSHRWSWAYDAARSTLNTASAYCVQRVVSARSCARPRAVSS